MTKTIDQSERELLFTRLYMEAFPATAKFVSRTGGSLEDARDAFQEALLVFYEDVMLGDYQVEVSDKPYLLGIARNIYLKKKRRNKIDNSLEEVEVVDLQEDEISTGKLLNFLQETSQRCMELLQSFYYEKLTMASLADRFGFRSERSATVQKYKCLEKVRNRVKEKSISYEDFLA
ncbi:MAG: sigma-70 family RNA polymerase sigma factor [Cyclobacteriaceae bacterium]|nr:sigma-70 family RNA polymerase sigma factor [Cyclobacteriaceae bacterium HetDA_MAG_MS6]